MTQAPGSPGVRTPSLRRLQPHEALAARAVWEESHLADDPGSRPRGGWSIDAWATKQCALLLGERIVGLAGIRAEPQAAATAARIALTLEHRQAMNATLLVSACVDLAREAPGNLLRLFVPERAHWAVEAARAAGFIEVRSIYHMLLPANTHVPSPQQIPGIRIRPMNAGEEGAVLEALNRNWAGTWDFVPIRREMLDGDLEGQREGMLLAVDAANDSSILATCHAVFDRRDQNPDGDPRAWISNLTVDAEQRGRGLGRTMLLAGIQYLRNCGAGSTTLGVDAGDPAPLSLYQSVGFTSISTMQAWDKSLRS
jgi:ribosomal protein S18 acetylase RimI-like enzyme